LEDRAWYTPLVPARYGIAIAGLVLEAVYNAGPGDAPRRRKASMRFRTLKALAYGEYRLATVRQWSGEQGRIVGLRLRMMMLHTSFRS